MIANNWTQLIGLIIQVGAALFGVLKSLQGYFEHLTKKQEIKSKEAVDVAKSQVELARANSLSANHVAEVLKNYHEVIEELENMKTSVDFIKHSGDEKNFQMLQLINKIEDMVKLQTQNFTEFIMNRAK